MLVEGQSSTTVPFDQVTMHCKRLLLRIIILRPKNIRTKARFMDKYDHSTRNYTQTVLVNGKPFPSCLPAMAMPKAGGSAVDCAETNCGTNSAHCKLEFQIFKVLIA